MLLDARQRLATLGIPRVSRGSPGLACLYALLVSSCATTPASPGPPVATAGPVAVLTPAPGVAGSPLIGEQLMLTKGCGGCHTVAGVPGATGVAGPNLTNIVVRPTLAGDRLPMSAETMTRWLLDPHALKPETTMPRVGLSQQEAQDLTAFLFSQPYNPGP